MPIVKLFPPISMLGIIRSRAVLRAVSRVAPVDHLLRLTHIVSKELLPALQMNDFALAQAKFEGWLQEAAAQRICWKELQEGLLRH